MTIESGGNTERDANDIARTHGSAVLREVMDNGAVSARKTKTTGSHEGESSGSPNDDGADSDLVDMNSRFAVVRVGGKTRVVCLEDSATFPGCRVPVFSTIADFVAFFSNPKKFDRGKNRLVGIGRWWIDHEQRRQLGGIVYAPNTNESTKLNLWTGFAFEPRLGDCSLYVRHIRENVCSGNEQHAEYLLSWMARAVQEPGRIGEVAVVLRGKEGVGKGVFVKEFGRLFGSHFRHVVHAKHLTGHFNAHLQQCSVLYADEAFFAGDRVHESILKSLITEETLMIEPKGIDPFSVLNCIHLLMSSNSDWVVPAGADARRYFVLDVADTQMQCTGYFSAITKQLCNGGREALLHFLLDRDISNFDVRRVPQTEALAEQKAHSRRGVDQLIEIIAHNGTVPVAHHSMPNIAVTSGEERGKGFYCAARTLVPELKFRSSPVITGELKKNWGCKPWKSGCLRGIEFPPLDDVRDLFDRRHRPQAWPDIREWSRSDAE